MVARSAGKNGFTMIELTLLIVVLSILVLATLSRFTTTATEVDAAAKRLRSDIQLAQDLAVTGGTTYGFRSMSSTAYEIFQGAPGIPALDPLTRANMIVNLSALYRVVSFSGSPPRIDFDALGVPTITGLNQVVLTDGVNVRTLTISANTGSILGP